MSLDPLVGNPLDPTSYNRYMYARNNPALWTDPSGKISQNYEHEAGGNGADELTLHQRFEASYGEQSDAKQGANIDPITRLPYGATGGNAQSVSYNCLFESAAPESCLPVTGMIP
jgi:hypothetical protein